MKPSSITQNRIVLSPHSFSGDYERHECALNVSAVSALSDAGDWSCEVEGYVIGPARGSLRKAVITVVVTENENESEGRSDT